MKYFFNRFNFGLLLIGWIIGGVVFNPFVRKMNAAEFTVVTKFHPTVPKLEYSSWRTGPLDVAVVFAKTRECENVEHELIFEVSDAANLANVEPKLAAAIVATESGCNQFAISPRGAVGLTQVVPRIWKDDFDFAQKYNLLNRRDNLTVGMKILSGLMRDYGVRSGIRRYQGLGTNCETCDNYYTSKILKLTGMTERSQP